MPFINSRPNNSDIAAFMNIQPDVIGPPSVFDRNDALAGRRAFLSEGSSKSSTTSGSSKAPSVASIRTSGSGSSFRSSGSSRAAAGSSSESSHAPRRVTVSRTRALPPAPLAKPPRPSQAQPFEPDTTKMAKIKKKAQLRTREEGIVVSDEDVERSAAWLSPPKRGVRATSDVRFSLIVSSLCTNHSTPRSLSRSISS